jgi:hypothetical protein
MSLAWLMLIVSAASLASQAAAVIALRHRDAAGPAERTAGRGYARTVASRIGLAVMYTAIAALAVAGIQVPGSGGLSAESLIVFTGVQVVWLANSVADVATLRRIRGAGGGSH